MERILRYCKPFLILVLVSQPLEAAYVRYSDRPEVRVYIEGLVARHQLNKAELLGIFRDIVPQEKALESISKPAERVLTWKDYRRIFLTDTRIQGGIGFWQKYASILSRAEKEFGVPAEIIVAIIGVESKYGKITGSYSVLSVLVTLGFDFPRRAKFFKSELEHFLLLARDEQFDLRAVTGSYAGAMGMPQFISSSYRSYAVDFDQDGRRDLWSSKADVIGSVASYFKKHGWQRSQPVVSRAKINKASVTKAAVGKGRKGLKPEKTVKEFSKMGAKPQDVLSKDAKATLLHFDGEHGDEYWLGLKNFYVITRYNHSAMYAMAVYQLSQEIKKQRQLQLKTGNIQRTAANQ